MENYKNTLVANGSQLKSAPTPHGSVGQFPALRTALELAERGYWVFPIAAKEMALPGNDAARQIAAKNPLCKWKTVTTCEPEGVRTLFARARSWVARGGFGVDAIGVGVSAAHSGIVVLDLDAKARPLSEIIDEIEKKSKTKLRLTGGCVVTTPSNGRHVLYRAHGDIDVPLGTKVAGIVGFDVRAGWIDENDVPESAGYIATVGSQIGKGYVRNDLDDDDGDDPSLLPPIGDLPKLPDALAKLLAAPASKATTKPGQSPAGRAVKSDPFNGDQWDQLADAAITVTAQKVRAYLKTAIASELRTVAGRAEGDRNATLNKAAHACGTLVACGVDDDVIRSALMDAAEACGLGADEAEKTTDSGLGAGMANPRQLPVSVTSPLPQGFSYRADGWIVKEVQEENEDGTVAKMERPVCSHVVFLAVAHEPDGMGPGKLFKARLVDGREVERFVANALTADPKALAKELLESGVQLATDRGAHQRVATLFAEASPTAIHTRTEATGWQDGEQTYVLPDVTIGGTQERRYAFTGKHSEGYETKGALLDWQTHVAGPLEGNTRAALAFGAAFAAPLLGLLQAEGAVIHLVGGSSSGKSTLAFAANSVWGGPALLRSWRTTDNAVETTAQGHNDCLLVLDELSEAPAKSVSQMAYMLANGHGKSRMRADGSPKPVLRWRNIVLSTGEIGLATKIGAADNGETLTAGQTVRFIEVPAEVEKGFGAFDVVPVGVSAKHFADTIKKAAAQSYGTAGRTFVEWLVAHPEEARELTRRAVGVFERAVEKGLSGSAQVGRVAMRFGLLFAGLRLAIQAGVLPWSEKSLGGIFTCFDAWLAQRGHTGTHEAVTEVEKIDAFIAAHRARFEPWDGAPHVPIRDRAGFFRETYVAAPPGSKVQTVLDSTSFYFFPSAFQEACGDSDPQSVAKHLAAVGRLQVNKNRLQACVRLPRGVGNPRVYVVTVKA